MVNNWYHPIILLFAAAVFQVSPTTEESKVQSNNQEFSAGNCLDIIDPETGLVSTAFVVDTLCQGESLDFCFTTDGCNSDVEITGFNGNLGQVIITPPTSPFPFCFSYTAPANLIGEDVVEFELTNFDAFGNVETTTTVELTFVSVDPSFNTTVIPPQEICSPATSATLEAINPDPIISGYWVILQGGGTINNVNDPITEVTNIGFGENIYMWRQDYPCQSTFDLTVINLYDGQAPDAEAGPDVELCSSTDTYVMQANDPLFSATGTWEITFGNATINDINDPNAVVTNLGIGCNVFQWNIENGPCPGGETVSEMSICVYDQNTPDADAGQDINICHSNSASNSVTTNALDLDPYDPATGTWSLVEGFGVIEDLDDNETIIDNLQIGVNKFTWTVENGNCPDWPQVDTLNINVFDPSHPFPDAGEDEEYCAPVSVLQLNGNSAIAPAIGSWTVIEGTGSFADNSDPNTTVSNLSIGINTFRWTINNGPCSGANFFDEVSIIVYDPNSANADAGPDASFCSDSFTTLTLSGSNISFPSTGEWSVISPNNLQAVDILNEISDPQAVLSGIAPGEYILQWTVNNGPCAGLANFDQVTILIYPENQTIADAGDDVELCTPITSFELDGNSPLSPGLGTWQLISGQGALTDVNNPNSSVTNLGIGENVFEWSIDNGDCNNSSSDLVSITVFNLNNEPANAGIDQEFCADPNNLPTISLNATAVSLPALGQWQIIQGSGTFSDNTDPQSEYTPSSTGTIILEWAIDNGVCDVVSNTDQIIIELFDSSQEAANAGTNIEICSDQASVSLDANLASNPAIGTWSVVQGTGTFSNPNSSSSEVTGFSIGTNTYRWTINNGVCAPSLTFDDVEVIVYDDEVPLANAGDDLEICNNFGPVVLNASQFQTPATGQWEVISGTGTFSNSADPNSLVSGWSIGENVYQWTVNNGTCSGGGIGDQMTITVFDINADQSDAGDNQELCLPQSSTNLDAVTPSVPSTGIWSVVSGTGFFEDDTDPNTLVSGLSTGNNVFLWTIDNGACAGVFSESTVTISLFEDGTYIADAGDDQNFCEPISSASLEANTPAEPSYGEWTIIQGEGLINDPTNPETQVTNLTQGENIFQWNVYGGPCPSGNDEDQVTVNIFNEDHPLSDAGTNIEICTPISETQLNGSIPISPATGTWIQISGPNTATFDPIDPSTNLSGLIPGVYEFQWQINNGPCPNGLLTDNVTVSVYDDDLDFPSAGSDINICTPASSVNLNGSALVGAAQGTWSIIQGGGTFADINDPNTQVTNIPIGNNIYQWLVDNGPCGFGTLVDQVQVSLFDENSTNADAGEDILLCSPISTSILSGSDFIEPATVLWELVSGSGTIANSTDQTTEVTDLQIGENIFRYTVFNGNCANAVTQDEVSIFIFDSGAPPAFAGIDQIICSPSGTTNLNADPAVNPGIGTWTQISGPSTLLISNVNSPITSVGNLTIGEYILEWSLDYSTCGSPSDQVKISVFDSTFELTDTENDLELCSPNNSATLSAETPTFPAIGEWEILQGSLSFQDVNDPNTDISNVGIGTNIIVWNVYNGECSTENLTDTVEIVLYPESLPDPFAGIDQQFCTSQFTPISVQMTAFPIPSPGIGTWSLISGSGTFEDIHDPNSMVNNIGIGVNEYMWTSDYGSCAASNSSVVTIEVFDTNQEAAAAGPDQEFCTPVPSVQLQGNAPISPAQGTWTQIVGTANISDPNDPNATLTNLANPGVYIWRWTIDNGPCDPSTTNDLITIFVYDENAPDAQTNADQELCFPNTSTSLTGNLPVFPGIGTWTQIEGFGSINNQNNPNSPVSNLSIGDNCFVWEIYNGPCANSNSTDTLCIKVFDPNSPISNAGDDIELCSNITTASLDASIPAYPSVGTWVQTQGIPADIGDVNDPNTEITNLSIGVNQFQWTVYNGPCPNGTTSDVVNVLVYDINQEEANAGIDQDICLPVNSTNLQGNSLVSPALGQWSVFQGTGTILDISNPTSLVTDLGLGVNGFIWTIDNGACSNAITRDTVYINLFDNEAELAFAHEDIQECFPVSELTISADPAQNAAQGYWTQLNGNAIIADSTENITEITNLGIGTFEFLWTLDNGPCGISTDTLLVKISDPETDIAFAGDNQSYCSPISSAFLEGSLYTSPDTGIWQIITGSGTLIDPTDPNSEIVNLTVGETILSWTINNGPCNGISTDFVSIFIFDENAPNADAGIDQEYCLPQTETNLNALPATFPAIGSWTSINGSGTITDINNPTSLITDLEVGENIFLWSVDNSPCANGLTQDTVSIFIFPDDYTLANAGSDQALCSPLDSTEMAALTPDIPSIGEWNLTSGSASIDDINSPTSEIFQLGIGTNNFAWVVDHGPCEPQTSLDFMSIAVFDNQHPPAYAGIDQEICLPENSVNLNANPTSDPAIGTWSLINGSGEITDINDATTPVTNLQVGNNLFVWTVDNGPCDNPITTDTICVKVFTDDSNLADAGTDIDVCGSSSVNTNALTPDAPSIGTWSYISGPGTFSIDDIHDPSAEISALTVGEYQFLWTVYNGPCIENSTSTDTLNINIFDINQQDAFAGDTLEFCWPVTNILLNADPINPPSTGTWNANTNITFSNINDPQAEITDLSIGEHILTWSVDNGPCGISIDDLVINIFDPNEESSNAGIDQEICTSDGGSTLAIMNANSVSSPAFGTWEVVFGPNPIISDINDPEAEITNIGYGETQLVWSIYNGACDPHLTTDTMSIFHFDSDILPLAGPDQEYCGLSDPNIITLQGNAPIGNTAIGTWSITSQPAGSNPTINSINDENSTVSNFDLGSYELTWVIDNGLCGIDSSSMLAIFYDPDLSPALAGIDAEVCEDEFEPFNLDGNAVSPPTTSYWSAIEDYTILNAETVELPNAEVLSLGELPEPLSTVENTIVYTVDNGVCGISQDSVIFTLIDCLTIDVPDAFSPNADQVNDTWFIPNLDKYPDNTIEIFNRWGTPVYSAFSYTGDWNGVSNHPSTIGDELPMGTYFYTLDLGDGTPIYKGFVYLKR